MNIDQKLQIGDWRPRSHTETGHRVHQYAIQDIKQQFMFAMAIFWGNGFEVIKFFTTFAMLTP